MAKILAVLLVCALFLCLVHGDNVDPVKKGKDIFKAMRDNPKTPMKKEQIKKMLILLFDCIVDFALYSRMA